MTSDKVFRLYFVVWILFLEFGYFCTTEQQQQQQFCNSPPYAWCENDEITAACHAKDVCNRYKEHRRNKRLYITLLYESLCADCQKFVKNQLKPDLFSIAQNFVDFEFVPFGNAELVTVGSGLPEAHCPRGKKECWLNVVQACAIKYLHDDQRKWFPFVHCMIEELSASSKYPNTITKNCFKKARLRPMEIKAILRCNGSLIETSNIQQAMEARTKNVKPYKHSFVPWILVNNISVSSSQLFLNDFLAFLCSWYVGERRPEGCQYVIGQNEPIPIRQD